MPKRITELAALSSRMIEALRHAHVEYVEDAMQLGPWPLAQRLQIGKPLLSSREIDTVLRELFGRS